MANSKSAEKRIILNKRNRLKNRFYKSSVRTLTKAFFKNLEVYKVSKDSNEKQQAKELLNSIYSLVDKGVKKHVFHKNFAARKKSRLASSLKLA